jgi:alkylation response protein AidB-like acyl-CoA dehydrogenase
MQLELTDDQELFRSTTRAFIEASAPISEVRRLHGSEHGFDPGWWRQAAELGWTAMLASEAAGGGSISGRPLSDVAIVADEIGRMTTPGPFLPVNVVTSALSTSADDQHAEVLASLVAGTAVATWALGEPGSRWATTDLEVTADLDGSTVLLSGVKSYVEAADASEYILVAARTDGGTTQVLVPANAPGVTITPARSLDLAKRFSDVRFQSVRLPRSAIVGRAGEAEADIERQRQIALILQSAETAGCMDRVFEFTLEYMSDRHTFGRPISSYQALKHRMADLVLQLESAKGCIDASLKSFDNQADNTAVEASVTKAYVGAKALHLIQECMQFHGGISVTWEHDIHLYLRRATVNFAALGTPEQHRERICRLLGL